MPDTKLKRDSRDLLRIVLPAAARGDLESVKRFLRDDVWWLYKVGPHGRTMLWEATYKNRIDTVRYLIERGANVNVTATYYTPLRVDLSPYAVARHHGNTELSELLADGGALFDLHSAAYFGELERVRQFAKEQPEMINVPANLFTGTPLRVADVPFNKRLSAAVTKAEKEIASSFEPSAETVRERLKARRLSMGKKELIARGIDTSFDEKHRAYGHLIQDVIHGRHTSKNRHAAIRELHRRWQACLSRWDRQFDYVRRVPYIHTSLHYAVQGRQLDVAKLLIERGAEVKAHSEQLLNLCLDNPAMMKLLVKHGADVKAAAGPGWVGDTDLETLAKRHTTPVDINQTDGKFTLLIDACRGNHNAPDEPCRVQSLLDRGAAINARDYKGKTALHRAAQAGFLKIGTLLCESGADVEARDNEQETPIFDAVRHGRVVTTKLLLERGANVHVTNRVGRSLLDIAKRSKKPDASKVLRLVRKPLAEAKAV